MLRENGPAMFEKTGETVNSGVGRPAELWKVVDEAAIRERLRRAGRILEPHGPSTRPEPEQEEVQADELAARHLAAAEDDLLFALAAKGEDDALDFAREAIEELEEADVAFDVLVDRRVGGASG